MPVDTVKAPPTRFLRGAFLTSASGAVALASGITRSLVLANVLGPASFGTWTLGLVWLQWGQSSHLTILNGFRIAGAQALGAADTNRFVNYRRLTWTACAAGAIAVCVGSLLAAGFVGPVNRTAMLMCAALLVPFQLYTFSTSHLLTRQQFGESAAVATTNNVAGLGLTVMLGLAWGFPGAVAGYAAGYVVALLVASRAAPVLDRPLYDRHSARELLSVGLPLGVITALTTLILTLDRVLIGSFLGAAALGQYALTAVARSSMSIIPNAVAEVMASKTSTDFGAGRSTSLLIPFVMKMDRAVSLMMAPLIGLAILWAPLLIRWLLPEYVGGVGALRIFLLGLFFAFPVHIGVLMNVAGQSWRLVAIQAVVACFQLVAGVVAVRTAPSIESVAVATGVTSLVAFVAVNSLGFLSLGEPLGSGLAHAARCLRPALWVVAGLWIASLAADAAPGVRRELVETVVFALVNTPNGVRAWRAATELRRSR
jgi:O-antigen/teichoic acid export membrane protein